MSPIVRWVIPVSSICMIWVFPIHSTSIKRYGIIRNIFREWCLTLNGKDNKEATAICFEIRIPKKKNKELLRRVPSKIYEVILLWKKTEKKFGLLRFPNIITEQWGSWQCTFLSRVQKICNAPIYELKTLSCTVFWCSCLCLIK